MPTPAERRPGRRVRSHSTRTVSSRLTCAWRSVDHTGSVHTTSAATTSTVAARGRRPASRSDSAASGTVSSRFAGIAAARTVPAPSQVSGTKSSPAKGGYVIGSRSGVARIA